MKEAITLIRLFVALVLLAPSAYALHRAYVVTSAMHDASHEVDVARAGLQEDDTPAGKRPIPRGYVAARGRVQSAEQTCWLRTHADLPRGELSCDTLRSLMQQDKYRGAQLMSYWGVTVAYMSPSDQNWRVKKTHFDGGAKRIFVPGSDIDIAVDTRDPEQFQVL
jgi:hypothetical protein